MLMLRWILLEIANLLWCVPAESSGNTSDLIPDIGFACARPLHYLK